MITAKALTDGAGVRHGFLSRRGGVSEGLFQSLNCGLGSGDAADKVAANRARALQRLGCAGASLVTAFQCHSADVVAVTEPWQPGRAPRADGLVTDRPGVVLGILTADCAPILLADPQAGVIGAAHAGWKGARAGIAAATVKAMTGLGAVPARILAAIGPAIGRRSYEVGAEFHRDFIAEDAANRAFFDAAAGSAARPGHFMFDLAGYVTAGLEGLGLAQVESLQEDTFAQPDRYFSYRRATLNGEKDYGRVLSAIALM